MLRSDGRALGELRPITIQRRFIKGPEGAALVSFGDTRVLCTASLEERIPPFLRDSGQGWVTAEYAMLPGSASGGRIPRDAAQKGRALEISRLIGRSLRSVVDRKRMGERQITVDCDVLQADGGTRTAAITGGYVALHDAFQTLVDRQLIDALPITGQCAAVSLGIRNGQVLLDLNYEEDSSVDVDLNVVMKNGGGIIEVQGTAEQNHFTRDQLTAMLDLAEKAIDQLFQIQRQTLAHD